MTTSSLRRGVALDALIDLVGVVDADMSGALALGQVAVESCI